MGAHDVVELLKREVEDVFLVTNHAGLHEALGFFQQRLLVDEVAADDAVLRILPVPDEGPDPVDHPLGLLGLVLPVRQGPQALEQLLFLLPGLLPALLEAPLAGARLEVLDVAEDHGHERRGAFAPTRPRDVDLADAAHAVRVEVGAGWRRALPARPRASAARRGSRRPRRVCRNATTSGYGRITSATSSSASPISDVTLSGTDCVSVSAAFFSPSHACRWSLSHHEASIAAHDHLMASRIEQDPLELLDVGQDEVEQRRSGLRPDGALQGGDGGLVAPDQLGDDGRIGLDRGGRGDRRGGPAPGSSSGSDRMKSPRSRMVCSASPISGSPLPMTSRRPARVVGEASRWATSTNSLPPASYIRGRAVSWKRESPRGFMGSVIIC